MMNAKEYFPYSDKFSVFLGQHWTERSRKEHQVIVFDGLLHPLALKAIPFIAACAFASSLSVSLSIIAAKNESVPPFIGHIALLLLLSAVCIKVFVSVHITREQGFGKGVMNYVCMSAAKYGAFVLGWMPLLLAAAQ